MSRSVRNPGKNATLIPAALLLGRRRASDVPAPFASNVNYAPGTIDPNVAVAPIGRDSQVCYVNASSAWVDLVADHLGTIRSSAYIPAVQSGAPDRKVDTRSSFGVSFS